MKKNAKVRKSGKPAPQLPVKDTLIILALVTGILLILGFFFYNKMLFSVYYNEQLKISPAYYFDYFVRGGIFKYMYFLVVITLVYWALTRIVKRQLTWTLNGAYVLVGFLVALGLYYVPPYDLHAPEPLPGSFWPLPTADEEFQTNVSACGSRIDFFFYPNSEHAMKWMPEIEALRKDGMQINMYCLGDHGLNNDLLCEKTYGLDPDAGIAYREELDLAGIAGLNPAIVIGCKYVTSDVMNASTTREYICLREPGLCR